MLRVLYCYRDRENTGKGGREREKGRETARSEAWCSSALRPFRLVGAESIPCHVPRLVRARRCFPRPGDRGDALAAVSGVGGCEGFPRCVSVSFCCCCFACRVDSTSALDLTPCPRQRIRRRHQRKFDTTPYFRRRSPADEALDRLASRRARKERAQPPPAVHAIVAVEKRKQVAPSVDAAVKRLVARPSAREGEGAKPNATLSPPRFAFFPPLGACS